MSEETLDQPEQEIPEETAIEQHMIPFAGDDLAAALGANGDVYIHLNGMITALGLSPRGQTQRIQRTPALARGLRRISLETSGGLQRVNCLRVDKVALWLAGVETSRIKPAYRAKVEVYQEDLAPIATRVFMRVMGIQMPPAPPADMRLASMLDQFDTLIAVALDMQSHMTAWGAIPEQIDAMRWQLDQAMELLEGIAGDNAETHQALEKIKAKTAGLTPAQARQVQEQISRIVNVTTGTPGEMKHATLYGRIRHRFRVPSYSNVPDTRFEELMQFLRDELQRATDGQEPEQGSLFS